jgi:hypothetical protein
VQVPRCKHFRSKLKYFGIPGQYAEGASISDQSWRYFGILGQHAEAVLNNRMRSNVHKLGMALCPVKFEELTVWLIPSEDTFSLLIRDRLWLHRTLTFSASKPLTRPFQDDRAMEQQDFGINSFRNGVFMSEARVMRKVKHNMHPAFVPLLFIYIETTIRPGSWRSPNNISQLQNQHIKNWILSRAVLISLFKMAPERRTVEFKTVDGLTLRGWFFPVGVKGPCIIMAHGVSDFMNC